ncbi:thioredoxin family protein [Georgenia sp. AZ-5]|uniref:DF family (seleno)protein n=1 Tax=Georgenia sp. AZ-5 TaxID=3367526 RepID=UPI003754B9F9
MKIELLYFAGCPNWQVAHARLSDALARAGLADQDVDLVEVTTDEDAEVLRFAGSPTVLINGVDPFPGTEGAHGLACRMYVGPTGIAGSPTVEQMVQAITATAERA